MIKVILQINTEEKKQRLVYHRLGAYNGLSLNFPIHAAFGHQSCMYFNKSLALVFVVLTQHHTN